MAAKKKKKKTRKSYRQTSSENEHPSFRVQNDNRLFRIEKLLKLKQTNSNISRHRMFVKNFLGYEFQEVHAFV